MSKRIEWLDGLKGFACIGVFLHHFLLSFFPGIYMGREALSHTASKLEYTIGQLPVSAFFCGEYMVGLFCLISGIVISYQILSMKDREHVSSFLLKRYPKLALPLFAASFFVYLMLQFQLFTNVEASALTGSDWLGSFYQNKESFSDLLYSSFLSVWFIMDTRFSNAFWMMKHLLIGSALSALLSEMSWGKGRKFYVVYGIAAFFSFRLNSMYSLFILGSALAFYMNDQKKKLPPRIVSVLFLILGVFGGGYPTYATPEGFYLPFPKLPVGYNTPLFYHTLGAFFTVLSIYQLGGLKRFWESRPLLFMSRVSYSFFLLHIPVLFSVSTGLFQVIYQLTDRYILSGGIVLFASFVIIFLISYLFHVFIEKPCYRMVDWGIGHLN